MNNIIFDLAIFDLTDMGQARANIPTPDDLEDIYSDAMGEPLDVVQLFNTRNLTEEL